METKYLAIAIVAIYIVGLAIITGFLQRSVKSAGTFTSGTTGSTGVPAVLVGMMLMSEFIGTSAIVGTAQEAYKSGISASWNIIALAAGFVFYGFFLAGRYKTSGHNTISAILNDVYGRKTRLATSIVMIFALQIVSVALYAGGGTILAILLDVDRTHAIVVCGIVSTLYVFMGGMRTVVYTNVIHALVQFAGLFIALYFGMSQVGGLQTLQAQIPPEMFNWTNVGWGQILAWFIAGMGATFSTQYVIQAINTTDSARSAKIASFSSAVFLVPFGIIVALVGMTSLVLFPDIPSIGAFAALIGEMNGLMAGIVSAGLAAALFGSIAAFAVSTATLLYKDFYVDADGSVRDERKALMFIRVATIIMGLLPIVLAIYTPNVLSVTFLGKALRASLSVLVLLVFFAPSFGTRQGAFFSILGSLVATLGWFMLGNPFGIDNAYVALVVPLLIMSISHVFRGAERDKVAPAALER
ncbi:MAG TPA: sodium:solute symporter family protein [Paracoccaceae bacterium]|nr:sodium:solute symporter family protein [Paracoccaceae bacterium]